MPRSFPVAVNLSRGGTQRFPLAALLLLAVVVSAGHCAPDAPGGAPLDSQSAQLLLSPSNPQIAQGTTAQFSLRGVGPDGHVVDLTDKAAWRVVAEAEDRLQQAQAGLVQLGAPGRYRVVAEYDGRRFDTPIWVTTAALRSLALNPTAPKLAKGLTQQFKATATFSDSTTQDVTATASWSVKDLTGSTVAALSTKGLATAKNVGKARITARYMTSSASATLEVTPATLQALALSPLTPRIAKGTTQRFIATGTFSDGTTQEVSSLADWIVTDVVGSDVATIDGTGNVTGGQEGQAKVAAEYQGQVAQTTLTVTAAAVVSLALSPASATIVKGATQKFTALAGLSDGTTQDVSAVSAWTATDVRGTAVARVDASGLAQGQMDGEARIDCVYGGAHASASLEVKPAALLSLKLSPSSATLPKGLSLAFLLTGSYSDGSTQDLTTVAVWTARDMMGTDVTSISESGVALGKNRGQAELKAEHLGKSATATLQVDAPAPVALSLAPVRPRIVVGQSVQLSVQGRYSDGSTKDVSALCSYSAADIAPGSGVASIDSSGLVLGKSLGQAQLVSRYLSLRAETPLTVSAKPGACSADKWCWQNPLPQGNALGDIWGSDANNVWAVGDRGAIVKWNGTAWAAQASGSASPLLGIWGSDTNNVWAVGAGGTILKWNGTAWAAQASGSSSLHYGIWGIDTNNVWAVGYGGTILNFFP